MSVEKILWCYATGESFKEKVKFFFWRRNGNTTQNYYYISLFCWQDSGQVFLQILLTQRLVLWVHRRWHFLEFWKLIHYNPAEMCFFFAPKCRQKSSSNCLYRYRQSACDCLYIKTHFRRVLVDQFSKFQKMSSPMNPQK